MNLQNENKITSLDNNISVDYKQKSKRIKFVIVTNPFEIVKDKELKGDSSVYSTKYETYVDAIQSTFLVKINKRGEPMRVHTRDNWSCEFKSFMNILYKYRMFPIIECGRCSMIREVCIVDIDGNYDLYDIYEKLKCIKDLPECVITQNSSTKHWQIQFYLKSPLYLKSINFYKKNKNGKSIPEISNNMSNQKLYISIIKRLAKYFGELFPESDINYQGTMFRNPFSENQEISLLFRKGTLSSLKERRPLGNNISEINEFLDENNVVLRKNVNLEIKDIEEKNIDKSRHKLTMVFAREWIWSNMKNGNIPNENDLSDYLIDKRFEIGNLCEKEPHSIKEIESQVHSLYTWSVENFNGSSCKGQWESSIQWNKNQRASKIKRAKKIKKIFEELLSEGQTLTEIAKHFKMSRTTLYTYMALFFVMDTVKTIRYFKNSDIKFAGYYLWEDIISNINDKIKLMKLKYGNSKIKWKELNYNKKIRDYKHVVCYDIPLEGNHNLELRYSA